MIEGYIEIQVNFRININEKQQDKESLNFPGQL